MLLYKCVAMKLFIVNLVKYSEIRLTRNEKKDDVCLKIINLCMCVFSEIVCIPQKKSKKEPKCNKFSLFANYLRIDTKIVFTQHHIAHPRLSN